MLTEAGFIDIWTGTAVDTFAGASEEDNARVFGVYGYPFIAKKTRGLIQ